MSWSNSQRRFELPTDWPKRRLARFQLDDWTCVDCGYRDLTGRTLECDHTGDRLDHRLEQLRTRCGKRSPNNCHGRKTSRQAVATRRPKRPTEPHPGQIN